MTKKAAPRRPRKTDGKPKGTEWTRNRGKMPVDRETKIQVRFRNGNIIETCGGGVNWNIDGKDHYLGRFDVMAWRLLDQPAKPARKRRPKVGAPEHVSRDKMTAASSESATAFNTDHVLLSPRYRLEASDAIEEPGADDETKVGWILLISVLAAVLLLAIVGAYSHA